MAQEQGAKGWRHSPVSCGLIGRLCKYAARLTRCQLRGGQERVEQHRSGALPGLSHGQRHHSATCY
eukprot:11060-Eustigmatos_ZCMA.PRE.1